MHAVAPGSHVSLDDRAPGVPRPADAVCRCPFHRVAGARIELASRCVLPVHHPAIWPHGETRPALESTWSPMARIFSVDTAHHCASGVEGAGFEPTALWRSSRSTAELPSQNPGQAARGTNTLRHCMLSPALAPHGGTICLQRPALPGSSGIGHSTRFLSVYETKHYCTASPMLFPRGHTSLPLWSCRGSNPSPIHVPILTLFIRLVRIPGRSGQKSAVHLHHSVFLSRETRQWPSRTLRSHEERRTPRPRCAGDGPCPRHCRKCFCRL